MRVLKKWLSKPGKKEDGQEVRGQSPEPDGDLLSGEEILDKQEALPRFANREDLFDQVIQKVVVDYNDVTHQLNTMLETGQMEEGRFLTHTLRGVMGNIGAKKIFETASCLEDCFANDQKTEAAEIIKTLSVLMQKLCEHIKEITSCDSPSQASACPSQVRQTTITELMDMLGRRRPADCPEMLEMLKTIKFPGDNNELDIDQLMKLIEGYEFDKAIDLLSSCVMQTSESV